MTGPDGHRRRFESAAPGVKRARRPGRAAGAAALLAFACGCDGGRRADAERAEVEAFVRAARGARLEGADAAALDAQAERLADLALADPAARAVRDACVSFRRTLAAAERDRARAAALEAAGEIAPLPALLARVEAGLDRAESFGVACELGVHGLASR